MPAAHPQPRVARIAAATIAIVAALILAACGQSGSSGGGGGSGASGDDGVRTSNPNGKRGGTLTILSSGDVDYLDPGKAYYQFTYMVMQNATQRPLYAYKPDQTEKPTPDIAAADPQISADGRTVTVSLKRGVRFSPPVNREVTSKDVKYAIERGFTPQVANGYAGAYFGDLKGVKAFKDGDADDISGIETPDDHTVVFHLSRGTGATLAGALVLPLSAPVPKDYARRFDRKTPSTYGRHQVFTGPYMIENDGKGNLTGYNPGRFIRMVRNPNWDRGTDFRPAYVDRIVVDEGNDDTTVATRKVLEGRGMISGDFPPPPSVLQSLVGRNDDKLAIVPSGGIRYISLKTDEPPFDDINVRKAVLAGFDRNALRLTRGGETVGDIATHFIMPGLPGFDESGGMKGFGVDFLSKPGGDMALARKYLQKAGYANGRYDGPAITMVGDNSDPGRKTAEVALQQFRKLGFKVRFRPVTHDTMYTKFCNVPKNEPDVCPNVGWIKDFNDAQTVLGPTFNGHNIVSQNNSNWPLLDDEKINRRLAAAALVTDPAERARAFADVNRMIVEQAPAIPWIWDKQAMVRSSDVVGVVNRNNASWDPSFTSLESPAT
jgi:peptide/nickel transport system substrate-binding protein